MREITNKSKSNSMGSFIFKNGRTMNKDGNIFFGNYPTMEEAQNIVANLAQNGYQAVLGDLCPLNKFGEVIKGGYQTGFGVYIVKKIEKEQTCEDDLIVAQ